MYEDRINVVTMIAEDREDGLIKPINSIKCDGKGRASFSIRTIFNFINYRITNDLLMGYYIKSLEENNRHWIMVANAEVSSPGHERLNQTLFGKLVTKEFVFPTPGKHVLEVYLCERFDIGDQKEEDVDYQKIGKLVSTYFFIVEQ